MVGLPVAATPHERRPVQNYATVTGAAATGVASISPATVSCFGRPHLFTPRSADPGNIIGQHDRVYKHAERWYNHVYYIYIYIYRCVNIELCRYCIHSVT